MQSNIQTTLDDGTSRVKNFMKKYIDRTSEYVTIPSVDPENERFNEIRPNMVEVKSSVMDVKNNVMKLAREAPNSLRFRIVLSATIMICTSFIDMVLSLITFSSQGVFLAMYSLFFAGIICLSEGEIFQLRPEWTDRLYYAAKVFEYTFGRGAFLFFAGFFQLIQRKPIVDFISGSFAMVIGASCMLVGVSAGRKISGLYETYHSVMEFKTDFSIYDGDKDGFLESTDIVRLFENKGIEISNHEVEACFRIMDKNRMGKISLDDFCIWYDSWSNDGTEQVI